MKIWISTLALLSGIICLSNGQNYDTDFELFKNFGPYFHSVYPESHYDVSESTYLEEDDGENRRSFAIGDTKPRVTRSFSYVAPDAVQEPTVVREKRKEPEDTETEVEDYDYAKSYRDFVRENFGYADAKALEEDNPDEEEETTEDQEYDRIKQLSDKEAEESRKNPDFCKIIYKDGKECTVCKNPKTSAQSESCSYSSAPAPKKYAYKRERNYNSKDDEDKDDEVDHDEDASQKEERRAPKHKSKKHKKHEKQLQQQLQQTPDRKGLHYEEVEPPKNVRTHKKEQRKQKVPPPPRQIEDYYDDPTYFPSKASQYAARNKGNVEKVLEEFKAKDWSKCKRKSKNGLTCYYCKDAAGVSHEECMFVSEQPSEGKPYQGDVQDYDDVVSADNPRKLKDTTTRRPQRQASRRSFQIDDAPDPEDFDDNPTEKRTIKRMVSVKIQGSDEQAPLANKAVFYKKVIHVAK